MLIPITGKVFRIVCHIEQDVEKRFSRRRFTMHAFISKTRNRTDFIYKFAPSQRVKFIYASDAQALCSAVEQEKLEKVRSILESQTHVNVNGVNGDGFTLLGTGSCFYLEMLFSLFNFVKIMFLLLSNFVNLMFCCFVILTT